MTARFNICVGPALLAFVGLLSPSVVHADQLVLNGGFENGVYTSSVSGATNYEVPIGWTANFGFDSEPSFNHVDQANPYDGSYDLSIGNFDYEAVPTLSQTFSDVSADSYSGSIWVYDGGANGDPNAFFDLWVDGTMLVSVDDTVSNWTNFTFSFTGTGSDTLTVGANTNPAEWFADDVSVTGVAGTVIPEPSSLLLLATGLAGLAVLLRRRLVE